MSLATTTLSVAVGSSDLTVTLGSVTAIPPLGVGCWLFADGEAFRVTALPNTSTKQVSVVRGVGGSRALPHASGVTVYIGLSTQFYTQDPEGQPPTVPAVLPWINVVTGSIWTVVAGAWTLTGGSSPTGNVTGPATSTDGAVVLWDGTTGTKIKDGPVGVSVGPFTAITSITVVNGVITDLQGS